MPPLRERLADLPELVAHFGARLAAESARPALRFTPESFEAMRRYAWPGNVRELQNFVERTAILTEGSEVSPEWIASELCGPRGAALEGAEADGGSDETLEARRARAEREAVVRALAQAGGSRTLAARILGVSRRTLYNKLTEHGVA